MNHWHTRMPIYQQLADVLAAQLLDGDLIEGQAMPSVRQLAADYLINPLTVGRALQALDAEGLLDHRRGLGLFVRQGARERLRRAARTRFLADEWPALRDRIRRLGLAPADLDWSAAPPAAAPDPAALHAPPAPPAPMDPAP